MRGSEQASHVQRNMVMIAEEQAKDEVWSELISWVRLKRIPEKANMRSKDQEVLVAVECLTLKIRVGVLMSTKAANRNMDRRCMVHIPPRVNGVRGMKFMPSK